MARRIVIASAKGGVGKTTLSVSLALCLAKKGERVLLCDGDFGLNNADILLGVESAPCYDVVDVIEGRCRAKQAILAVPQSPCLFLLPSNRSQPERFVSAQALKLVLDALAPQFDYILIDSPSGLSDGFHRACSVAEEGIVVCSPTLSAIRDGDKTVTALKNYRLKNVFLIVNQVRGDLLALGEIPSPKQVSELLKVPLIGAIPLLSEQSLSAFTSHKAVLQTAKNLAFGEKKIYDASRKYRGFFGAVRRFLRGL